MVRSRLTCLVILLAATPATHAQNDEASYAEAIQELRDRLGPGYQTPVDPAEFAEAVEQAHATDRRWHAPPQPTPQRARDSVGSHDRFPPLGQSGWGPVATSPPPVPRIRRPGHPKTRLREAAFELERIAHHLEMADLPEESDAVREAASFLRQSARRRVADDASEPSEAPASR